MKKITLLLLLLGIQFSNAQDTCDTAVPITTGGTISVGYINGTQVPFPICADNGNNANAGEWYAYTPTDNYTVTITSDLPANYQKDTRFHVYTGTCGNLECYSGDDDSGVTGSGYLSIATFNVTAGTTYYIAWDNNWNSSGFIFDLIENPYVVPPPVPVSYINHTINSINSTYNKCIVDMNGDHKDDIVGVSDNGIKIHYQGASQNAYTISEFPITGNSSMPVWNIAAGDYNKDGYNDLVFGDQNGLTFWKSNATGTAYSRTTPGQYIFCQRINFVDINNDGNLDTFSCHDVGPNVYYLNDGTGNMVYHQSGSSGSYSLGVTSTGGNYASMWFDYDNDGDSDLFISKCSGPPCELHRNDGNGVFTNISALAQLNFTPVQSWSSAVADFDNDGDMDILVGSNGATPHRFFQNNLDTSNTTEEAFTNITAGSGWNTDTTTNRDYIAYDFDNDGFVDIMGGGNKIMFNQGDNTFVPAFYPAISVGAVGDLNDDGFLDILNGSTVRYAVPNENNWVKVVLEGVQSNSNGIGARVEIYGSWGKQIRDVRSGEGFDFMSSLNVNFGIGTATEIPELVVIWPNGIKDVLYNVAKNATVKVVQGSFPLANSTVASTNFIVYPNPVKDIINIQSDAIKSQIVTAEIYDVAGKQISKSTVTNNKIPVNGIAKGTYILLLKDSDGKNYSQKFIKS